MAERQPQHAGSRPGRRLALPGRLRLSSVHRRQRQVARHRVDRRADFSGRHIHGTITEAATRTSTSVGPCYGCSAGASSHPGSPRPDCAARRRAHTATTTPPSAASCIRPTRGWVRWLLISRTATGGQGNSDREDPQRKASRHGLGSETYTVSVVPVITSPPGGVTAQVFRNSENAKLCESTEFPSLNRRAAQMSLAHRIGPRATPETRGARCTFLTTEVSGKTPTAFAPWKGADDLAMNERLLRASISAAAMLRPSTASNADVTRVWIPPADNVRGRAARFSCLATGLATPPHEGTQELPDFMNPELQSKSHPPFTHVACRLGIRDNADRCCRTCSHRNC